MRAVPTKRFVYLVHRWTGVGGCLLMALWVVSGVVMLFVGYPRLLPAERLQALPALGTQGHHVPVTAALAHSRAPAQVQQIVLTAIAGQPRYRLREGEGDYLVVDATTGQRAPAVDGAAALASARAFLPGFEAELQAPVFEDRWTHSGTLDAHRPLFRVQMHDADATRLYISSTTGEVVMDAPRAQRNWNYVGAWLHWLYMFRDGSRDPVWSWIVIGMSAVCTLSALSGALAGIWRWRFAGRYKSGARTPYREFQMRWHHITGLLFGAVLITWIFSGLMSMNPLGVFDARGERPDLRAYRQGVPGAVRPGIGVGDALALLRAQGFAASEIEWRVLAGQPHLLARDAAGTTRLVVQGEGGFTVLARWPDALLAAAGAHLLRAPLASAQPLDRYDAYYFQRGTASMYGGADRGLPALRLDFADAGRTAVYLDPATGDMALALDRAQRVGRWLFNFLHSWDLPAFLRFAWVRDAVLILLSIGALAITVTGTVIGYRRLRVWCASSLFVS